MNPTPEQIARAWIEVVVKWTGITNNTHRDGGADDCAFCHLFHPDYVNLFPCTGPPSLIPHHEACDGCPIKEHTGLWGCSGTPYTAFKAQVVRDIDNAWDPTKDDTPTAHYSPEAIKHAKRMLEFVKSLKPTALTHEP